MEQRVIEKTIVELTNNIEFNIYEGNHIFTLGKENRYTISKEDNIATVVNVFSVEPQNQQKLIEIWKAYADEIAQKQTGFISATIHKSFDKTRIANYAQWTRKEYVETMLKVPDAKDYFDQMSEVASQN